MIFVLKRTKKFSECSNRSFFVLKTNGKKVAYKIHPYRKELIGFRGSGKPVYEYGLEASVFGYLARGKWKLSYRLINIPDKERERINAALLRSSCAEDDRVRKKEGISPDERLPLLERILYEKM